MANLIVVLFAVMAIVTGAVSLTGAALGSASSASDAWNQKSERTGAAGRTELTLITADINSTGTDIDISIRNTGQTALTEFTWWDVLIQYYDTANNVNLNAAWLTSTTTSPVSGEWAVQGIYLDAANATAEVYEPNVLNPGEEMIIRANISPTIPTQTNNQVTIATPNGIRLTAPFTR
ncbi:MAG: hypothetical protein QF898_04865 [SAR202 cluster bacterium]|jgi:hypothetical protein|nr:hypothetical protein [SAR202 cluster bacterium]MDP6514409.1 hypothetical protein [SAR202 cluster bacterium]MDP6715658.1 hypothetical protein [SAR202 cluster bacterium]